MCYGTIPAFEEVTEVPQEVMGQRDMCRKKSKCRVLADGGAETPTALPKDPGRLLGGGGI